MKRPAKKKKPVVTIYLNPRKERAKLKAAAGPELYARIQKATRSAMRDISDHFNPQKSVGGWPLDYWHYNMGIINAALGVDMSAYFIACLTEAGLNASYEVTEQSKACGSFVITKPAKRKAAK